MKLKINKNIIYVSSVFVILTCALIGIANNARKNNIALENKLRNVIANNTQKHYKFESPGFVENTQSDVIEGKFDVYLRSRNSTWNFNKSVFVINKYVVTGSGVFIWSLDWSNGKIPIYIGNATEIQIYPHQ